MGKQHVFLGAAVALVVALAWPSLRSETASALDLFFWLFVLLAMVAVVLWPRAGRDQRAELKLERRGWADRIDFDEPSKAAGDASPRRADPSSRSPGAA
jgi:hypothetical protein